jgi:hypothetical protein
MLAHEFDDLGKIDEYLNVIQKRVIAPIQSADLQGSCTATLLLLFAAIDGLGRLLDPTGSANVHNRITGFLKYMGGGYAANAEDLYTLRNSLAHNAINVESILSHAELDSYHHLMKLGVDNLLYVNTTVMYQDFQRSFDQFRSELQGDPVMMRHAAIQLEWVEIDDPLEAGERNASDQMKIPTGTQPPPIRFIRTKNLERK